MRLSVKGDRDPGYGATAKMLAESAVCLASGDLEAAGGFWTPASAMGDALRQRLVAHAGMRFEFGGATEDSGDPGTVVPSDGQEVDTEVSDFVASKT